MANYLNRVNPRLKFTLLTIVAILSLSVFFENCSGKFKTVQLSELSSQSTQPQIIATKGNFTVSRIDQPVEPIITGVNWLAVGSNSSFGLTEDASQLIEVNEAGVVSPVVFPLASVQYIQAQRIKGTNLILTCLIDSQTNQHGYFYDFILKQVIPLTDLGDGNCQTVKRVRQKLLVWTYKYGTGAQANQTDLIYKLYDLSGNSLSNAVTIPNIYATTTTFLNLDTASYMDEQNIAVNDWTFKINLSTGSVNPLFSEAETRKGYYNSSRQTLFVYDWNTQQIIERKKGFADTVAAEGSNAYEIHILNVNEPYDIEGFILKFAPTAGNDLSTYSFQIFTPNLTTGSTIKNGLLGFVGENQQAYAITYQVYNQDGTSNPISNFLIDRLTFSDAQSCDSNTNHAGSFRGLINYAYDSYRSILSADCRYQLSTDQYTDDTGSSHKVFLSDNLAGNSGGILVLDLPLPTVNGESFSSGESRIIGATNDHFYISAGKNIYSVNLTGQPTIIGELTIGSNMPFSEPYFRSDSDIRAYSQAYAGYQLLNLSLFESAEVSRLDDSLHFVSNTSNKYLKIPIPKITKTLPALFMSSADGMALFRRRPSLDGNKNEAYEIEFRNSEGNYISQQTLMTGWYGTNVNSVGSSNSGQFTYLYVCGMKDQERFRQMYLIDLGKHTIKKIDLSNSFLVSLRNQGTFPINSGNLDYFFTGYNTDAIVNSRGDLFTSKVYCSGEIGSCIDLKSLTNAARSDDCYFSQFRNITGNEDLLYSSTGESYLKQNCTTQTTETTQTRIAKIFRIKKALNGSLVILSTTNVPDNLIDQPMFPDIAHNRILISPNPGNGLGILSTINGNISFQDASKGMNFISYGTRTSLLALISTDINGLTTSKISALNMDQLTLTPVTEVPLRPFGTPTGAIDKLGAVNLSFFSPVATNLDFKYLKFDSYGRLLSNVDLGARMNYGGYEGWLIPFIQLGPQANPGGINIVDFFDPETLGLITLPNLIPLKVRNSLTCNLSSFDRNTTANLRAQKICFANSDTTNKQQIVQLDLSSKDKPLTSLFDFPENSIVKLGSMSNSKSAIILTKSVNKIDYTLGYNSTAEPQIYILKANE